MDEQIRYWWQFVQCAFRNPVTGVFNKDNYFASNIDMPFNVTRLRHKLPFMTDAELLEWIHSKREMKMEQFTQTTYSVVVGPLGPESFAKQIRKAHEDYLEWKEAKKQKLIILELRRLSTLDRVDHLEKKMYAMEDKLNYLAELIDNVDERFRMLRSIRSTMETDDEKNSTQN